MFYLSSLWPKKLKQIIFGSWMGYKYADNPKYLLEYILAQDDKFIIFWCGRKELHDKVPKHPHLTFVEYGSIKSIKAILASKYCFVDHGYRDLFRYNITGGANTVYLGHGMTLKNMGTRGSHIGKGIHHHLKRIYRKSCSFKFYICSSEAHKKKLLKEYAGVNIISKNVLTTGQPRNDFLNNYMNDTQEHILMKSKIIRKYNIPANKKIIIYLPTFRDNSALGFSFGKLNDCNKNMIDDVLGLSNAVIIEKKHFIDGTFRGYAPSVMSNNILLLDDRKGIDTQELLLVSDMLITDYSGCYFDFLLLDRPIIHYVYDLEFYANRDRGLYYRLEDVAGGDVVTTFEELCKTILKNFKHPEINNELRRLVRENMMTYEQGKSCKNITRKLFKILID